jgi:hypothetical protein
MFFPGRVWIFRRRCGSEFIRAAAELVAENCRKAGAPFSLVFTAAASPVGHAPAEILAQVDAVAERHQLAVFITWPPTGSCRKNRRGGRWRTSIRSACLATARRTFNRRNDVEERPQRTPQVERTAAAIRAAGKPLPYAPPITPESLARMPENRGYLCGVLGADEVRIDRCFRAGVRIPKCVSAQEALRYSVAFLGRVG